MSPHRPVRLPLRATVAAGRGVGRLSRLLGRGDGHAMPGKVAAFLDPQATARLAAQLPSGVVLVTGTNGKTTTTMLLVAGLTAAGHTVVTNPTGSNLQQGILTALLSSCDSRGRVRGTVGVFEVDEVTVRRVAGSLQPALVVVLNLFRDQLDRHAELEVVAGRIAEGLRVNRARVLLNADDPLVRDLAEDLDPKRLQYFGIEASAGIGQDGPADAGESDRCPRCGRELEYSTAFFAQLGHYRCPAGDFGRPAVDFALTSTGPVADAGVPFVLRVGSTTVHARTPSPGTYSLYNSLAALAACSMLGVDLAVAGPAISACSPAFGRSEEMSIDGRRIRLLLVKNPTGCAQVLHTYLAGDPEAPLLMALNDAAADGRDVSWIWDAPLELLAERPGPVLTCGTRTFDLTLRLRYAGLKAQPYPHVQDGLDELVRLVPAGGHGYVLATYTAMLALRRQMLRRAADLPVPT
jgi:lipid II isoglutaminyl synthase (glutamine-hydrolysing)